MGLLVCAKYSEECDYMNTIQMNWCGSEGCWGCMGCDKSQMSCLFTHKTMSPTKYDNGMKLLHPTNYPELM